MSEPSRFQRISVVRAVTFFITTVLQNIVESISSKVRRSSEVRQSPYPKLTCLDETEYQQAR